MESRKERRVDGNVFFTPLAFLISLLLSTLQLSTLLAVVPESAERRRIREVIFRSPLSICWESP